ncbi:MAG TPA: hypothetical protein VKT75_17225 [Acidobacteriaceae bacterium]|nr:hypothetical protein [Acidobacteriaceae bacterium]
MKRVFTLLAAITGIAAPAFATVTVSSPANNSTVSSPVQYVATATSSTCGSGVASMGIYVNNQLQYVVNGNSLNTTLSLAPGSYYTVVEEWDNCGGADTQAVNITVGTAPASGVSVTSPAPNSTVSSPVSYRATATSSCASGVASMGIYVNSQLQYVADGNSLNTTVTLAPGSYDTVVQDWDNCGGSGTKDVPITVSSGPAQSGVKVTSPAPNSTVTSPVQYTASATTSCSGGVSAIGIYVNSRLQYVANGSSLNTTLTLAPGSYDTVVQDWDNCNGSAKTDVPITVTSGGGGGGGTPGVTVTSPANNSTVTSPVTYKATATAPSSCSAGVASMGIYVNNQLDYEVNGSSLNTSLTLAPGSYNTVVQEWDNCGGALTTPVNITVSGGGGGGTGGGTANVLTWHMDNNRSGLNAHESALSPNTVNSQNFGKLFSYLVDGYVYGEPLLMSNVSISGSTHDVLYAATENDSVYAFDADSYGTGAPLWHTSLLKSGESPITSGAIKPMLGVTSTPVIDPSTNTIYLVSAQVNTSNGSASFRLNALDITTGAQKFGGPVTLQASVPGSNASGSNGVVSLNMTCVQRAALLLANGNVYIGFGGCSTGWLLAYNAQSLQQVGVFNSSPNLSGFGTYASAGGIWMGAGGPVADSAGNIYVATGNGPWDGQTAWSDSVLKFSPTLQLEDSFTPADYGYMGCNDADLAAGGLLLIPGTSELLAGGKTGKMYLLNAANLGHEQPNDAGATQTLWFESDLSAPYPSSCTDPSGTYNANINSYEIFGTAAYYNGSAYLGVTPTTAETPAGVRQFAYSGTLTPEGYTGTTAQQKVPGTTPFISSNGNSGGILWMIDTGEPLQNGTNSTPTTATLRAYDADAFPNALYNSSQNAGDTPGYGIKFTSPIVANGKVYISTGHDAVTASNPRGEIDVYGLK